MISFRKQILITCFLLAAIFAGCSPAPIAIPTQVPTNVPSGTEEACIDVSATTATLKVGEIVTITAIADEVEIPYFFGLLIKDEAEGDFSMMVNLPDTGTPQPADVSEVMEFVSAEHIDHGRMVVLRALQAGSTKVAFFVSGGNGCADASIGGATSESITITVTP
jgi:hypothetical protein